MVPRLAFREDLVAGTVALEAKYIETMAFGYKVTQPCAVCTVLPVELSTVTVADLPSATAAL